jgi:alanine racemase
MGIFSLTQLEQVEKYAKKMKVVQEVHLACDALLGREGFLESEFPDVLSAAKHMKHVRVTGMYAHFANIEDTNNFTHAERQIQAYARMREAAEKTGYTNLMTHISATSGLLTHEYTNGSNPLVRIGIGMYGLWPSDHLAYSFKKKLTLKPVLSWKTHIAQIKKLPAGRTIGYGLTYMTKKATTIALIPQGYADGYPRSLSNKGEVLIAGKRCPVLGRVSMNMFVVDASRVPHVEEGDEVILLGVSGKQSITAEQLGELSGTINYEVVTRINPLLPRVVVK